MGMLLDDVATALANAAGIVAGTWIIVKSQKTPEPDTQIVILEAGGGPRERGSVKVERPGFTILIRGAKMADDANTYATARAKLQAVIDALDGSLGQVLGGSTYPYIFAEGGPLPLGYDESGRPEIQQAFRTSKA